MSFRLAEWKLLFCRKAAADTVTERELAISQDTTHTENCIEKCDERSVERSKKPPNRMWAVGIITLTLLAFLLFKKQE